MPIIIVISKIREPSCAMLATATFLRSLLELVLANAIDSAAVGNVPQESTKRGLAPCKYDAPKRAKSCFGYAANGRARGTVKAKANLKASSLREGLSFLVNAGKVAIAIPDAKDPAAIEAITAM